MTRNKMVIGQKDMVKGEIVFDGDVSVMGFLEGELKMTGMLEVLEGGRVKAGVVADELSIRGEVRGNVDITGKMVLSGSGVLNGDAQVGRIVVEDGAVFNGGIRMKEASKARLLKAA